MRNIKKYAGIFLFFAAFPAFAQEIQNLFLPAAPPESILREAGKHVSQLTWFCPDAGSIEKLWQQHPKQLSLRIPADGADYIIDLEQTQIESPDFRIRTSGGKMFDGAMEKIWSYRGLIRGVPSSLAVFSFRKNEVSAVISGGAGNLNLVKYKNGEMPLYALFNDRDIQDENTFKCHSEGLETAGRSFHTPSANPEPASPLSGNCRRVDLYFECDHQLFLDQGGTVEGATAYVESLFNVVAAIYAQTGINIRISELFIHTQPDNYPSGTSFEALDAFSDSVTTRPTFNGTLGHLLSTLPRANGGVAYLDVLCAAGSGINIGYSNIYSSFLPLPYYSWTVNVLAHELGHNFGSPHTQSCSWEISPGVLGMLDSCFTAEGECYSGPRIASVGTVMSYCHLMNLGVDLSKGFSPLPGELIRGRYLDAACLPGAVDFPQLSISSPDSICRGSSKIFSVTEVPGASCLWSGPNGFSASGSQITIQNAGTAQEGLYAVVISKDGCESLPLHTRLSVNCIYAIPQTNRNVCSGGTYAVDYHTTFTPLTDNQFFVEISDAEGIFSNPQLIGSLSGSSRNGSIPVLMPSSLPPGNGYLIRIRSSSPAHTGEPGRQQVNLLALPPGPSGNNQRRCGPGSFQLQVNVQPGDSVFWYASENSSTPLASGNTFQSPVLTGSTSYWAESRRIRDTRVGPVPNPSAGDTVKVANTYHGIFVRVKKTIRLDSVMIVSEGPGAVHINIKDSLNTFTYKKIIRPVSGAAAGEYIPVGIEISPGVYRIDAENSTVASLLRLNNFFSYPLISEGVDIIGASVPGRYYFFYDWKIRILECPGPRKEIRAEVNPLPLAPVLSQSGQFIIASADTLLNWYKDGIFLGVFGDTLDAVAFGNGQYRAELLTADSCSASSALLTVFFTGAAVSKNSEFHIFPNPVKDRIQIGALIPGDYRLSCFDATGRKLLEQIFENQTELDFQSLSKGTYLLKIQGANRVFSRIILKE